MKPRIKTEIVATHVPNRLLKPCPYDDTVQPSTPRIALAQLATAEKTVSCANGKIESIAEIVQSTIE